MLALPLYQNNVWKMATACLIGDSVAIILSVEMSYNDFAASNGWLYPAMIWIFDSYDNLTNDLMLTATYR